MGAARKGPSVKVVSMPAREPLVPPSPLAAVADTAAPVESLIDEFRAAELLGVTPKFVLNKTRKDALDPLPYIKVGRKKRFRPSELVAWQNRNHHGFQPEAE